MLKYFFCLKLTFFENSWMLITICTDISYIHMADTKGTKDHLISVQHRTFQIFKTKSKISPTEL